MIGIISVIASFLLDITTLVSYINNNSFPKPLKKEEEKEYLEKMLQGDLQARRTLIERNLRLVAHMIKKFDQTGEDQEDLISIGTIGLIKAINTYDYSKGTRLATYAARCIENEILMHLRSQKKSRNDVYLQDPIGTDKEGNEISLLDILGSDMDEVMDKVEMQMMQNRLFKIIKGLKNREKKVLLMRYGIPSGRRRTQKEVAVKLGISRSYVSRIEKKVIKKIAAEFHKES
ncbi:MAG TPA: RNA polymerase sporulation sigma factor SigK [Firmicutes bacterium]|nr:RNA polymerase sporulation sigma factor SigK [Bacillota bacterium]